MSWPPSDHSRTLQPRAELGRGPERALPPSVKSKITKQEE